jgi:signal transduction histidine kinase
MKATDRDDKQMIVSVAKDQVGMVAISVKDNGIGISPDNLTNLFNHGFTTKKGGHGFGLHSGANFARQLGGSLIAESAGLGHGATFTLTLPIVVDDSSDSSTLMPVLHADSGVFDHHSDFSV